MRTTELILSQSTSGPYAIQTTPLVREVSYGVYEGLPIQLSFPEVQVIRAKERNVSPEDIVDDREGKEAIHQRQLQFLQLLMNEDYSTAADKQAGDIPTVLLVSHGGFIKRFINRIGGAAFEEKIENCSITKVVVVTAVEGEEVEGSGGGGAGVEWTMEMDGQQGVASEGSQQEDKKVIKVSIKKEEINIGNDSTYVP